MKKISLFILLLQTLVLQGCGGGFSSAPTGALNSSSGGNNGEGGVRPPPSSTPAPPTSTPADGNQIPAASNRQNCKIEDPMVEVRLMNGFATSYWVLAKASCTACHGDSGSFGGSGPKFASLDLARAFDSFYALPEQNIIDNALNWNTAKPAHGSKVTNGMQNLAAVQTAASAWASTVNTVCNPATPTPTPVPTPTPPGATPTPTPVPSSTPTPTPTPVPTATPIVDNSGTKTTIGIITQTNVLQTYRVYTGVAPSANTIKSFYDEFPGTIANSLAVRKSRKFLLPPTSVVDNMNSGSVMITTLMAAEHCNDLLAYEATATTRTFFKTATGGQINLAAANMSAVTAADVTAVVQVFAKRMWRRTATADEVAVFTNRLSALQSQGLTARQGMLVMCTTALSSLSANVR